MKTITVKVDNVFFDVDYSINGGLDLRCTDPCDDDIEILGIRVEDSDQDITDVLTTWTTYAIWKEVNYLHHDGEI